MTERLCAVVEWRYGGCSGVVCTKRLNFPYLEEGHGTAVIIYVTSSPLLSFFDFCLTKQGGRPRALFGAGRSHGLRAGHGNQYEAD